MRQKLVNDPEGDERRNTSHLSRSLQIYMKSTSNSTSVRTKYVKKSATSDVRNPDNFAIPVCKLQ